MVASEFMKTLLELHDLKNVLSPKHKTHTECESSNSVLSRDIWLHTHDMEAFDGHHV